MKNCIKCSFSMEDSAIFCPQCGKKQSASKTPTHKRRPNQYGSVTRLSGARKRPYNARVWNSKKQVSIGTYETEQQALDALTEWRKLHITAERYNLTLGDLYKQLLEETTVGESGLQHYASAWIRLSALENRLARDLVTDDFAQVISNAKKVPRYKILTQAEIKKLMPAARKRYEKLVASPPEPLGREGKIQIRNLASILCQSAMSKKLMDKNYAELVSIESEEKRQKRNLSKPDIEALFAGDTDECVMIILLYLYSGFRANELLKMKKSDVNIEKWWFIGGSKTEAGKNRLVPILPCIRGYVEHFMQKGGDYFITNAKCQPISYRYFLEYMFYPALDRLKIKHSDETGRNILTPHRTRHTTTQLAVAANVSPEALMAILGHTKYETTINFYGDEVSPEFLVEEFNKINSTDGKEKTS